mmetsp:Transcript_45310/g.109699  ORF Transcript_45310/g.109699 Transcript_45310/m.109699 type:complete len:772 (+) Transcript_45310:601-2916(+)
MTEQEIQRRSGASDHRPGSQSISAQDGMQDNRHTAEASKLARTEAHMDRVRRKEEMQSPGIHSPISTSSSVGAHTSTSDRSRYKKERRSPGNNRSPRSPPGSPPLGAHFSAADRARRKEDRLHYSNENQSPNGTRVATLDARVIEAFAVEEDGDGDQNQTAVDERLHALESQIQTMKAGVPAATVAEEKPPFWKRNRYCVLITLAVIIAGGITAIYFLFPKSDPTTTKIDGTDSPMTGSTDSPTVPPTYPPSLDPTTESLLYAPNSAEDCAAIALNKTVDGQESLTVRTFIIFADVSLTLELSDPTEVVQEMALSMQKTLGPRLADCPAVDGRRLQMDGKPMEQNVVGNAVFAADYESEASCDADSPTPCMRVLVMLNLFLKGEVETVSLTNRISSMFGQGDLTGVLGLAAPVVQIQVVSLWDSPPQQWPLSSLPPTDPPSLYNPNTAEACASISFGESVPLQDSFITKWFDIKMDVALTLQLSDLIEVIASIETRMQRFLGPRLADCPQERRLQESIGEDILERKLLIEDHVVGNALFAVEYQADQSCLPSSLTPCIRLLVKLQLFLKGEEDALDLVNRVSTIMGEGGIVDTLGLAAPFNRIEIAVVTAAAAPTLAPTAPYRVVFPEEYYPSLEYRVNLKDPNANGQDSVTFRYTVPRESWVAVGVSPDGSMLGSEVVIGKPLDGTVLKYRLDSKSVSGIVEMESQTLINTSLEQAGGSTVLAYTKILNEPGELSMHIDYPNNIYLTVYGFSNTFGYHQGIATADMPLQT